MWRGKISDFLIPKSLKSQPIKGACFKIIEKSLLKKRTQCIFPIHILKKRCFFKSKGKKTRISKSLNLRYRKSLKKLKL